MDHPFLQLKEAFARKFTILIVGRTGVGKSSTVNSLMGTEVAKVGNYEPTTFDVEVYESTAEGVRFAVVDTPGLCDGLAEDGNDERYLALIRQKVPQIDCVWFVSRLDETRVTHDERRAVRLLSAALGPGMWAHGLVVLTFAGSVPQERYHEAVRERGRLLRQEIAKLAPGEAPSVPVVAVDNTSRTTPDGRQWLGELWTRVFTRMADRAGLPFLLATSQRIHKAPAAPDPSLRSAPIHLDADQRADVKRKALSLVPQLAATGMAVGAIFGPQGAAVGGAIGALIGLFAWLRD